MIPDPSKYNPTPEYARELIERIGRSQPWVAEHAGISHRRIQYVLHGRRVVDGVERAVKLSYPEQFILECLAESAQLFPKKPKT